MLIYNANKYIFKIHIAEWVSSRWRKIIVADMIKEKIGLILMKKKRDSRTFFLNFLFPCDPNVSGTGMLLNSLGYKCCKDRNHICWVLSCLPNEAQPRVSAQRKRGLFPESGGPGHCGKGPARLSWPCLGQGPQLLKISPLPIWRLVLARLWWSVSCTAGELPLLWGGCLSANHQGWVPQDLLPLEKWSSGMAQHRRAQKSNMFGGNGMN